MTNLKISLTLLNISPIGEKSPINTHQLSVNYLIAKQQIKYQILWYLAILKNKHFPYYVAGRRTKNHI